MKRLQEKVENFESLIVKLKEESKKKIGEILDRQHHEFQKELDKATREMKDMQKEIFVCISFISCHFIKVLQNVYTQISTSVENQELK